ncbi:RHS repeat domain-containing protein [Nonomuraea endophytica]|uniref:RHS repeat domain-containing protein n=1 Tax=Nonomuraea endophytica TaxID=714136 RepID=UPI0037C87FD5
MNVFEVFREPPKAFSPAAMWWWSGEPLRRDRLRWQMERLVAGGVHNLVILNLAPSGPAFGADADEPPFLSEEWWELLDGVCQDAHDLGAHLWFYDQIGFSGADLQARLVQERPEFAGQWLAADGSVTRRGFDYLSREACAVLLDRVHGEFERRAGHWFGKVIAGSFQDELPTLPTWSGDFADEHATRRGRPFFPAEPDWHAYHLTRAGLAEEAFFRPLAEWHERNGLIHGCDQQDPARAGHPVDGVRIYADYARTHRWFSAPGSDHHGDARLHASLAHLYGRPRTWIEAFHSSGWGGTLEETFDWLLPWLRAGATLYNPHAVYYTTKRGWWEWAPPSTDWRQPYWKHYRVFAEAVTRLCAALSLGRHACDVAVLLPTATAQTGTGLAGAEPEAARAQKVYRELVGDMAWFATEPGVLDRLGLDADVIDEDSVRRAVVKEGRLTVSTEAYRVVVLPAVTVLDPDVATRLAEFAADGGTLITVGTRPDAVPGARFVEEAGRLGEALEGLERRVEAPVPALVREDGETTMVFLPASFPMASRIGVGKPEERGVDLGWLDAVIDFDPDRHAREMAITVRGVLGTPLLLRPFTGGEPVALPHTREGDAVRVVVPFDDGPAALLVFDGTRAEPVARPAYPLEVRPQEEWDVELVPTLDDTWSDFGGGAGVECRTLRTPDGQPVDVTFGPHGEQRVGDGPWTTSEWSVSRGLRKDPVHRETLGPKGRVPVTDADGNTSITTYTLDNQIATVNDGKGVTTYTYDGISAEGRTERRGIPVKIEASGVGVFTAAYDADGQLVQQTYPNGLTASYRYDGRGTKVGQTYSKSGTRWMEFAVTPDVLGRVAVSRSSEGSQRYTYDTAGRLAQVADTYRGRCNTRVYGFDANSNRTSFTAFGADAAGECSTSTTSTSQTSSFDEADRITDDGYSYDKFGRTTQLPADHVDGGRNLQVGYHVNDMVASLQQDGQSKTFTLDPLWRIRSMASTGGSRPGTVVNHYSDSSDSPAWIAEANGTWTRNISGFNGLAAIQSSTGSSTIQLINLHGDIVATCENTATATGVNAYFEQTEYGTPRAENSTNPSRYGWLGGEQRSVDSLGGLVLMGVRLYNPLTGRFLQVDPVIGGSANNYDYCSADPINCYDLNGTRECNFFSICNAVFWAIEEALGLVCRGTGFGYLACKGLVGGLVALIKHAYKKSDDPKGLGTSEELLGVFWQGFWEAVATEIGIATIGPALLKKAAEFMGNKYVVQLLGPVAGFLANVLSKAADWLAKQSNLNGRKK